MANTQIESLGIRNRNPFNLIRTNDKWLGIVFTDGRFCKFSSFEYGVRAGLINLFKQVYDYCYLPDFVHRYAPSSDGNNEAAYITYLRGILCDDNLYPVLHDIDVCFRFASAICLYESKYILRYELFKYVVEHYHLWPPKILLFKNYQKNG